MKDYKAYFLLNAAPEEVYAALTYAPTIELWTGEEAIMEPVPDTQFSLWGGNISGLNLAFEPGKKIMQQWDFGDEEEPSEVTLLIHDHKKGTSVELRHTGIPDEAYEDIVVGWNEVYFKSLEEFYA